MTSDWAGPYKIEQLVTDLAAFADALGLEQVALGGHSAGGPPTCTRHGTPAASPAWSWKSPRRHGRAARRVLTRPEGPLPFDWDVTALSNEFTDPQVSS